MVYRYIGIVLLFLSSTEVHAYLDPGTGSILIQGLIAAIAGGLFTLRIYWQKVRNFFSRSTDISEEENPESSDD